MPIARSLCPAQRNMPRFQIGSRKAEGKLTVVSVFLLLTILDVRMPVMVRK